MSRVFRIESVGLLIVLIFFTEISACNGQSPSDDLYILFDRTNNYVLEVGKRDYYHPELRFPLDVSRDYVIKKYVQCSECPNGAYGLMEFNFSFNISKDSTYQDITKGELYLKETVGQTWFINNEVKKIKERLSEATNLYLVDVDQLVNGKLVAVKVKFYDWIEN